MRFKIIMNENQDEQKINMYKNEYQYEREY